MEEICKFCQHYVAIPYNAYGHMTCSHGSVTTKELEVDGLCVPTNDSGDTLVVGPSFGCRHFLKYDDTRI